MNKNMLGIIAASLCMADSALYNPLKLGAKKYANGDCKDCGKKNVRRGRETGVYLCESCFIDSEEGKPENNWVPS